MYYAVGEICRTEAIGDQRKQDLGRGSIYLSCSGLQIDLMEL